MRTRRQYLALLGAGTASLTAGCSGLTRTKQDEDEELTADDLDKWSPNAISVPPLLPFSLPGELVSTHETRTRALLEQVPTNPSIPNAVIQKKIREERAQVEEQLSAGADEQTPLRTVSTYRDFRVEAAKVYGSFRAATGNHDGELIATRQDTLRDQVADTAADIEYRSGSPIEAVETFAPIEERIETARRSTRPRQHYPDNPTANVEAAGEAFEAVERGAGAIEAVAAIRQRFQEVDQSDRESYWERLAESSRVLDIAVDRTRGSRLPDPSSLEPSSVFDHELESVERHLYRNARRDVEFRTDEVQNRQEDGQYANAVIEAGRSLAGIAAMDAIIAAINGGKIPDQPTKSALTSAAKQAENALSDRQTSRAPVLQGYVDAVARRAYAEGTRHLSENYFDPAYAHAEFRFAALFAAAVPEAVSFVIERLES